MVVNRLAMMLAGLLIIPFLSGADLAPCPTGTVAVNVTSTTDARGLADALNCTGQGDFDVAWYSNLSLSQRIEVSNMKNVTITGFGSPTITGGLDDDNDADAVVYSGSGTGGIFVVSDGSTLRLSHLVLVGGNAENGGAVELRSSSSLFVYGCTFSTNSASTGGAIYSASSSVHLDGRTTFENNYASYGGAIYGNDSRVHFDGHTFLAYNSADFGGATHVESSIIYMDGGTYFEDNVADQDGGGMYISASKAYIKGSTSFLNNSAENGGAVKIHYSDVYMEGNTSFVNNSASSDGGAVREYYSKIYMEGRTSFVNNSAVGKGGAMFDLTSEVYMDGSTSFVNNSANHGGAIHMKAAKIAISGTAIFAHNSAADGGAVYTLDGSFSGSSTPAYNFEGNQGAPHSDMDADYSFTWNLVFTGNFAAGIGGAIAMDSPDTFDISGATFQANEAEIGGALYITSSDQEEREFSACVFEDNVAKDGGALYLNTATGADIFKASSFRGNVARISGGAIFHTGLLRVINTAFAGNEAGVEGPAITSIGLLDTMSNASFLGNVYSCQAGEYGYFVTDETKSCRLCFDEVCARCSSGSDALSGGGEFVTDGYPVCAPAPMGATAPSRGTTVPTLSLEKGYYRTSNLSHVILECFQGNVCLGGTDPGNYCEAGYTGPYCAVCEEGFAPGVSYSCRECSDGITWLAAGLAVVVGVVILLMAILAFSYLGSVVPDPAERSTRREARTRFWEHKCSSCSAFLVNTLPLKEIKIVVTVWQIISQFGAISGDVYPEVYKTFVSKLSPINLDMDVVLSYSCIVENDFYDHLLVATIAPALVIMMFAGSYVVARSRNSRSESAMRTVLHKHQAATLYLALFIYSPVSYKIFQTFACDELDNGQSYLRADYSLSCLTPLHRWYEAYAMAMVGLYTVGITAVFACLLARHRHDLVKGDREAEVHLRPFHGLWGAYKPSRYYYEVIECGRRICLTGIAAFFLPNSREQLSVVLVFAVVFVFISEAISPFAKSADMNLYRWGNGIVVASVYAAFLMKIDVGHDKTPAILTFSGVLIAANIFMVITVFIQTALLVKEWGGTRNAVIEFDDPVRQATCERTRAPLEVRDEEGLC